MAFAREKFLARAEPAVHQHTGGEAIQAQTLATIVPRSRWTTLLGPLLAFSGRPVWLAVTEQHVVVLDWSMQGDPSLRWRADRAKVQVVDRGRRGPFHRWIDLEVPSEVTEAIGPRHGAVETVRMELARGWREDADSVIGALAPEGPGAG